MGTSSDINPARGSTPPQNIELDNIANVEDGAVNRLAESNSKFAILSSDAKDASDSEHRMTLREAVKLYPKAIGWSMFLSSAIAMEAFDIVLIASFFAYPAFKAKFGVLQPNGTYLITAAWQAGLSNSARIGQIIGLFINGIVSERFGYRKTMLFACVGMIGSIFVPFFAPNIKVLMVGEVLMGIPWGIFQTLSTAYASEVCPIALRGYLTTYVNMMWGLGQMIASGVLRGLLSRKDEWSYRIPFALQWVWPPILIIGMLFAPDSPWWLIRKGRSEEARKALRRLTNAPDVEVDKTMAMIFLTNELEKEIAIGAHYWDCFKGVNLRRTEITMITWAIQPLSGASLMGFAVYFFQQAGLPTTISFDFAISLYAVAMVGVVISWFLMSRLGRRTLYLCGLSAQFTVLMIIGFVSLAPKAPAPSFATGALLLLFTLCYDTTIGTLAYSIVTEIPSGRLRTKSIVLARILYNCVGTVNSVITPYMLNTAAWNWKGKAGFFWAGSCLLCLVWTYFRLPEPKGRTYAELDILFERGISARKFKSTKVDVFSHGAERAGEFETVKEKKAETGAVEREL